jgi:CheY-like chemotaxis protein/HPt (histidine-containing phosphotransfer) domain-containing protein
MELETQNFDLLSLLDDFTAAMSLPAHEKGLELVCAAAPDLPTRLNGDLGRLRQILTNLVGNAIKFTHRGKVVVAVDCLSQFQNTVELRFSVRDTGIGISPDKMGLLFNKFTQVDASITRQFGGTGLGLAISKQLAELMGGRIGAESEAGQGSIFWFTARLMLQAEGAQGGQGELSTQKCNLSYEEHQEFERKTKRILLVEDNITNQQVALGILEKLGYRGDAAANGIEALQALERIFYDLVLMDVQMPEMDGLEATRRVRGNQSFVLDHDIPIIAMTAHAFEDDRRLCLDAGMNDFISKPVEPQALSEALERWLPDKIRKDPLDQALAILQAASAGEDLIPSFNKAALMQRLMGDERLAHIVIKGFLEDIPKQIQTLKNDLETGNMDSAGRKAHTIKGASANISGEALMALAFKMEKYGRSGDMGTMKTLMPDLEARFECLKEVLLKEILDQPLSF